jgi:hypothetical protein
LLDVCLHGKGRPASELNPNLFFHALGTETTDARDVSVQSDDGSLTVFRAEDVDAVEALPLPVIPYLVFATPVVVLGDGSGSTELYAAGHDLLRPGTKVLLRAQGGYLPVDWSPADDHTAHAVRGSIPLMSPGQQPLAANGLDVLHLVVRPPLGEATVRLDPGLISLEVQAPGTSHLLSNWMPVVFTESEGEASDLRQASRELRIDYGRVMDYVLTARRYRHMGQALDADDVRTLDELERLLDKARSLLALCLTRVPRFTNLTLNLNHAVKVLRQDCHEAMVKESGHDDDDDDSAYRMSSSLIFLANEHMAEEEACDCEEARRDGNAEDRSSSRLRFLSGAEVDRLLGSDDPSLLRTETSLSTT